MDVQAYSLLHDNVHDFKTAAMHVEAEIRRLGLRDDSDDQVAGVPGRRHRDMWVSMKSVSHFNIGVSLELLLKLILILNDVQYKRSHGLVDLHDDIPLKFQRQLQSVYEDATDALAHVGLTLVAFVNSDTPDASGLPILENYDLTRIRNLFLYLDEDVLTATKRYSWELIGRRKWRHYISDISVLAEIIERVLVDLPKPETLRRELRTAVASADRRE